MSTVTWDDFLIEASKILGKPFDSAAFKEQAKIVESFGGRVLIFGSLSSYGYRLNESTDPNANSI